jgi:secondary-alkyl amine dehydrogenase [NAD(P)+]
VKEANQHPRVVVYGTGQFGQMFTRLAVQKGINIVAAFNHAGPKVGQDLGVLSGLDTPLGIVVEDCDRADFNAVRADVAIVAMTDRLATNFPAYKRLLGAGINVICHGAESSFPMGIDPEIADRIDRLARDNNVSFTGTGVWDAYRIWPGIVASGPLTEIDSIYHESTSDASVTGKELMLAVGVDMTPEQYQRECVEKPGLIGGYYKTVPHHLLTALGYHVIDTSEHREPVLWDEPVYSALLDKEIPPGRVVGTRIVAKARTEEGLEVVFHHEGRLFREGEREYAAWTFEGKPWVKITVERRDTAHYSTASLVHRVRDIMAAPCGIQVVSQLGTLKHSALSRAGSPADVSHR